ncbi:hypothetical protein CANCADRAFT_98037 [Tortispora caseinolytica NRRL Y-17796]|uniref:Tetrapyrrole methylase domain-containing protein n=1 Tax=Tortispora caseinolytica NRRL Y-17796 TaxID=767744 RepID=A0A1E4TDU0_9ASCO|nr:hypothetical protein CANCADRAFT_98037 [Tortispora caseinolytica NRRL Y-17796]
MLLSSLDCAGQVHLVVGISPLAVNRIRSAMSANAQVVLVCPDVQGSRYIGVRELIKNGRITWYERNFEIDDLRSLGRIDAHRIVDIAYFLDPVYATDEVLQLCRSLRIWYNVADSTASNLRFLSTYTKGSLQIGVTTNGKGCRLANRIRRHITETLPANIEQVCDNVGSLRSTLQAAINDNTSVSDSVGEFEDDSAHTNEFNRLSPEYTSESEETAERQLRYLSQAVEYMPLSRLADLRIEDLTSPETTQPTTAGPERAKILLVGAGPGSVDLLTVAARNAILEADVVLTDKLVPQQVVDIIPKHTTVHVAKKFPGNADNAQQEFLDLALGYALQGKTVVRLKQGDPYVYGRGGEEYVYFSERGFEPLVIPGITSALSAPLAAGIPCTMRDVADQILICTGTGRRGALPVFPEYISTRTTVFLMALHRIEDVVQGLFALNYPSDLPCSVIERAWCPDQRVIRTTLRDVAAAVAAEGSRPPGLLVVGHACAAIHKTATNAPYTVLEGLT